jgi:inhibitor of cysteine peptidase
MKIINYIYRMTQNRSVALIIIAAMACWSLIVPAWAEKISLTEAVSPSDIKMNIGDDLEITLEGNPTTGYIWEKVEGDNKILSPQGDYKYTPARPMLTGSGGKFIFSFRAATTGATRLHLIYHRTFEKNVPPLKIWEATVIIK